MSGILDPKTRVIDTVITQEGKRQISTGGLRAVYATVSDKHSYYEKDIVSGSTDATKRLHYEAPIENNNDSIIMEHDDSGNLLGYPMSGPEFISNDGTLFTQQTIGSETTYSPVSTPSAFASTADAVIATAIDRFTNLQIIGTRDPDESLSLQMKIRPSSHTFTINNKFPFVEGFDSATTNLDFVEPLFFDEMLANSPNFQFLPPVTEKPSREEQRFITSAKTFIVAGEIDREEIESLAQSVKGKLFGNYTKYQRPESMNLEDIMNHLNIFPELRRLTDHSTPFVAPEVIDSDSARYEIETAEPVLRDPDTDLDQNSGFSQWYHSGGSGTYSRNDSASTEMTANFGRNHMGETSNGQIGVYKSEENSTAVNLTSEQLPRERVQVFFDPTSSTNNIVMQIFEVNSKTSKLLKLDVIHYGEFSDPAGEGSKRPRKNLFFAGKIFENSIGLPTFINLFTIILD